MMETTPTKTPRGAKPVDPEQAMAQMLKADGVNDDTPLSANKRPGHASGRVAIKRRPAGKRTVQDEWLSFADPVTTQETLAHEVMDRFAEQEAEQEDLDDEALDQDNKSALAADEDADDEDTVEAIEIDGEEYEVDEIKAVMARSRQLAQMVRILENRNAVARQNYDNMLREVDGLAGNLSVGLPLLPAINWDEVATRYPADLVLKARQEWDQLRLLHEQRQRDIETIGKARGQQEAIGQMERIERLARAMPALTNPDYREKLSRFAVRQGARPEVLGQLTDPFPWKMIEMAYRFHEGQRQLPEIKRRAKQKGTAGKHTYATSAYSLDEDQDGHSYGAPNYDAPTSAAPTAHAGAGSAVTRPSARPTPKEANRRKYLGAMRRLQKSGEPDDAQAAIEARLMD
jgi:hypothetical protein